MSSGLRQRHAAIAALPISAALVALLADLLPIRFAYRPNDLGIISRTTLAEYPTQQETFWYLFCLLGTGLLAWWASRSFRSIAPKRIFGIALEAIGAASLCVILWLPWGSAWPPVVAFSGAAVVLAIRLTPRQPEASGTAHESFGAAHSSAPQAQSAQPTRWWWLAFCVLASIYSVHPMFPDGLWGSLAHWLRGSGDLNLAADNPIFHMEWGEHAAWADAVRRGGYQGLDFLCLYGPLYELSLVGVWGIFGRSLASLALWQGVLYFAGALAFTALGVHLVRHRAVLLLFPVLLPHASFRIGLAMLGLACLVKWRERDAWSWCAATGVLTGASLFFSQEFGLALFAVAGLALLLRWQLQPALYFLAGLLCLPFILALYFASGGALQSMLGELAAYPNYVAAGYANLPLESVLKRLPVPAWPTEAHWELRLRLALWLPAISAGALLLCIELESLEMHPARALQQLRARLFASPIRFGIAATALFGLLSFRAALGRSDLQHLTAVAAPASLLLCVGIDRVIPLFRKSASARSLALWRAALLAFVMAQSGLLAASKPLLGLESLGTGLARLGGLASAKLSAPDPRVSWLTGWLRDNSLPEDAIFVLPNLPSYYYLSGRENPTRFALAALVITDAHRRELLASLRAHPPRFVVRDRRGIHVDGLGEPQQLGERTLRWIEDHYRIIEEGNDFEILERQD